VGTNLASFSQQFNQDGAEVFRQSVEQGVIPAIVNYSLVYLARIPAVSIHIHGNRRDFYEELKTHTIITHTKKKNGQVVYKKTWPEIGSLKEFRNTFHSLTVDIDSGDFRTDAPGADLTEQLETMAFSILESNILPSFFVILRVSQVLFPGRVGILMMSEVIVAIVSASLLIPEETMLWLQWVGAAAIVAAGLIEVLFGYSRSDAAIERDADPEPQET